MSILKTMLNASNEAQMHRKRSVAYCFSWRKNPTELAIRKVVQHAIHEDRPDVLMDALEDSEYRALRKSFHGINSLHRDLELGVDYFATTKPDVIRYLRLQFLEQTSRPADATAVAIQQQYCREFEEFLQLDVPSNARKEMGLHQILTREFPITIGQTELERQHLRFSAQPCELTQIELLDYRLGDWRCRCARLKGQHYRFMSVCKCGTPQPCVGNPEHGEVCRRCKTRPWRMRCTSCGTRVTWDLIWRFENGSLHPSQCVLPVFVRLKVTSASTSHEVVMQLMELPVLMGFQIKHDQIRFDIPAVLWADRGRPSSQRQGDHQTLFGFREDLLYDGEVTLLGVLEKLLYRTFRRNSGRSGSLAGLFERLFVKETCDSDTVNKTLSDGFQRKMTNPTRRICERRQHEGELTRLAGAARECSVTASPHLHSMMAAVRPGLLHANGFVSTSLKTFVATITRDGQKSHSNSELTCSPCGVQLGEKHDENGIVRIGATVYPGDVLVGIHREKETSSRELRQLYQIFGQLHIDRSLVYEGAIPARVVSVVLDVREGVFESIELDAHQGVVRVANAAHLLKEELACVTLTLSVQSIPMSGDKLYATDDSFVVVCSPNYTDFLPDCAMPSDIVVAPEHPWAPRDGHSVRMVVASTRNDQYLQYALESHGSGKYSFDRQMAPDASGAQELLISDVASLIGNAAPHIAMELLGPHADCITWRSELYGRLVYSDQSLFPTRDSTDSDTDLHSESLREFVALLEVSGIRTQFADSRCSFSFVDSAWLRSRSFGEVRNAPDFQNNRPHPDGLLSERIFGPWNSWQCACGKDWDKNQEKLICEKCGVAIGRSTLRRTRMGHIQLNASIVHPFLRGASGPICCLLEMEPAELEGIVMYLQSVVVSSQIPTFEVGQVLSKEDLEVAVKSHFGKFQVSTGAEAILHLLAGIASNDSIVRLRARVRTEEGLCHDQQRMTYVKALRDGRLRPEHVIQDALLVLPADIRHQDDLHVHYGRVLERNNRLRKLLDFGAPDHLLKIEKHLLQSAVDALFFNSRQRRQVMGSFRQPLDSIGDRLQRASEPDEKILGRLLSKRIDFSAATRIVTDSTSSIHWASMPVSLAWDLFEPLTITALTQDNLTLKDAVRAIRERADIAQLALRRVSKRAVVILGLENAAIKFFAQRIRLTDQDALGLNREIFEHWGWHLLGSHVRLFAVHSRQARREALRQLLPSVLLDDQVRSGRKELDMTESIWSVHARDSVNEFVRRCTSGETWPMTVLDVLAAGSQKICLREGMIGLGVDRLS